MCGDTYVPFCSRKTLGDIKFVIADLKMPTYSDRSTLYKMNACLVDLQGDAWCNGTP